MGWVKWVWLNWCKQNKMAATTECEEDSDSHQEDTEELAVFREQWKAELNKEKLTTDKSAAMIEEEQLSQAEELYWMGVSAEENKDMGQAILYYRQAVQLVPDIDKRVMTSNGPERETEEEEKRKDVDVLSNCLSSISLTESDVQYVYQNSPSKTTHISILPIEILKHILSLIVLYDLDLRSLEQFGMVCKRFYVLARDELLWKQACIRLWNDEVESNIINWRQLYITRPHLHFNGVYISRSTYVRAGEQSLDHLYKPFHTVVYYRYLRFFPDGTVLYLTSPDVPLLVVNRLRVKKSSEISIRAGQYTYSNDNILVVVNSKSDDPSPRIYNRRQPSTGNTYQRFHMELGLKHSSSKLSSQLQWKSFSCQNIHSLTGHIQVTEFDLNYTYTPFIFSRVKSYSLIHQR